MGVMLNKDGNEKADTARRIIHGRRVGSVLRPMVNEMKLLVVCVQETNIAHIW